LRNRAFGGDGPMSVDYACRLDDAHRRIADASKLAGRSAGEVRLVAVSKYATIEQVVAVYAAGQRDFGENYVLDGIRKKDAVEAALGPVAMREDPPRWHMIGQLQSNKAARASQAFDLIHTLASMRAARAISRAMAGSERAGIALVQIHLGGSAERGGIEPDEAEELVREACKLGGLRLDGVMGVAPPDEDPRPHFARLRAARDRLSALGETRAPMTEISAGMSDDFEQAILEGATIVRLGRTLFGS